MIDAKKWLINICIYSSLIKIKLNLKLKIKTPLITIIRIDLIYI